MPDHAALVVEHLESGYGGVMALHDVSISAEPGTITAVLGANGAGKTTLLATISGFVRPRQGRVALDGTELTRRPPEQIVRAGVAHVPEGQAVITELTVEENLRVGGLWRHGPQGRAAALAVGEDERLAAPCADSVISSRNSKTMFACRWLRAPEKTRPIPTFPPVPVDSHPMRSEGRLRIRMRRAQRSDNVHLEGELSRFR